MLGAVPRVQRPVVLALLLMVVIDVMGAGLLMPMLPSLVLAPDAPLAPVGASPTTLHWLYGVALGLAPLGAFLAQPRLGAWSDVVGRRPVLLVCVLGTALGYLISALAVMMGQPWWFLVGRLLDGLTAGAFPVAQAAMVALSTEANHGVYMGLVTFAASWGYVMGPLVPMLLGLVTWWRDVPSAPLWVVAGLSLVSAGLLAACYRDPPETAASSDAPTSIALTEAFGMRGLRAFLWLVVLCELGWWLVFYELPLALMAFGPMSLTHLAGLMVCMALGFAVGSLWWLPRWEARWGAPWTYTLGTLWLAVGTVGLLVWPGQARPLWLFGMGVGGAVSYAATLLLASQQVGPERQGWILGVISALGCLMMFVAGVWAGGGSMFGANTVMLCGVVCSVGSLAWLKRGAQRGVVGSADTC